MIEALKTDKGTTRENNQDYIDYIVNEKGDRLYILCDGMGGYKGGEVASFACSQFIKEKFIEKDISSITDAKEWLYSVIMLANKKIRDMAKENIELNMMGTTVLCLLISKDYKIFANVGDSRIYAYNHKELLKLSEDQTFANALLKAGYINEKEAEIHPKKNLLLSAIGSSDEDLDIQIKEINGKYNYLLCSDGLYNMVDSKEILKIINNNQNINDKVNILVEAAIVHGGKDNISVILVEESL